MHMHSFKLERLDFPEVVVYPMVLFFSQRLWGFIEGPVLAEDLGPAEKAWDLLKTLV